jgi:hypothetical protein
VWRQAFFVLFEVCERKDQAITASKDEVGILECEQGVRRRTQNFLDGSNFLENTYCALYGRMGLRTRKEVFIRPFPSKPK